MVADDESGGSVPNSQLAGKLAAAVVGATPTRVTRFSTGLQHYVFDVEFDDRAPVVVRVATEENRAAMVGAYHLSNQLRPAGVPLPQIIAAGLDHRFPYLILERFPGTDLMHVIQNLSPQQQNRIAEKISAAQRVPSKLPSAGRYGYAVTAEEAPHPNWSSVLEESLAKARKGITSAGLFESYYPDSIATLIESHRSELDAQPATPFLHDTTTKNVIIAPDSSFSGIVDVDDLCFGDPRSVVALTMVSLENMGTATHYTDAWMAAAGFKDDRIFRLYAALTAVIFMSEHGQTFNGNVLSTTERVRNWLQLMTDRYMQQAQV